MVGRCAVALDGQSLAVAGLLAVVLVCAGCSQEPATEESTAPATSLESLAELEVTDESGQTRHIKDYVGDELLVVVVSRGFSGTLCPYCCTQVRSLVARYADIQAQDARVLVVFPVEIPEDTKHRTALEHVARQEMQGAATELPYPIVCDVGLKAVDLLGIRGSLARPATYIIDSQGRIQYAYVGQDPADRPSVDTILEQLRALSSPAQ